MSIRIMAAVWQAGLPPIEKLVALSIADNANDSGHCWPSIHHLVQKTGLSERTIQEKVKSLGKLGWLTRQERNGKSNVYVIQPPQELHPAPTAPPHVAHPTPAGAAPPPPQELHPEPSIAKPPKESPSKIAPPTILPDWMPDELWQSYLEMRRNKRAVPTDKAIVLLIAKLDSWRAKGHDPSAILEKAITSNWTDLYEPKETYNENTRRNNNYPANQPNKSERARAAILESARELGYAD